jgi:ALG11 mannosyltransferase N-terminus
LYIKTICVCQYLGMMILFPFLLLYRLIWILSALTLVTLLTLIGWHRTYSFLRRRRQRQPPTTTTNGMMHIAFFHPYCTGGGGGERVLWKMIQVLGNFVDRASSSSSSFIHPTIIIYTTDVPSISYQQGTYVIGMNFSISCYQQANVFD